MQSTPISPTPAKTTDAKTRYMLLDGLRGVAALIVIGYHIFEGFATSSVDQHINHGYLAVDFFFMLSGFVIGYAYDDRWQARNPLSTGCFIRRRIIRLHPMLIMGVVIGVIAFMIQGCVKWDGTPVDLHRVGISALLAAFMIPAWPGAPHEVRGNGEMFPLNGPAWSLFFEYIASLIYAVVLRRLSNKALAVVVVAFGLGLAVFGLTNCSGYWHMGVGWTLADKNFLGGMLRVGFAFSAGMFMARVFKPRKIRGAFWICSAAIALLLSMPFMGTDANPWLNAAYDLACIIIAFPILLHIGASGTTTDRHSTGICDFLGRISYPVYIVHYPLMYLFYAWLWADGLSFSQSWPVAIGVVIASIALAWICLRYYDEPLRRYLSRKNS